jgi:UDP:flavonoid glycosyltransferase YjiC (YdhE family)
VRVLVVAAPMVGHVLPLVPLAAAFRQAGHDVVVATAEDGVRAATLAGLPVRDVAPGLRLARVFLGPALRRPLVLRAELRGAGGLELVGALLAAVADRMADGLLELTERWRPDLVLHEPLAVGGSVAAARAGVPVVLVDANLFDAREQRNAVVAHLGPVVRRHGIRALPEPTDVVLTAPPSLVGPRAGRPMRFVPAAAGTGRGPELSVSENRPTVLVSRSTVATPGRDRLMPRVVRIAAGVDADVVLARPEARLARRRLPPNVRTTGWLDFAVVLPRFAGIVHHGGAGTLLTALASGVPQLVVPGTGDRTVNARLLAARGAGVAVPIKEIDAACLERLVHDRSLSAAAREVAAEIAAMPPPADLVEPLSALAR